jgi:hypothetical protein
MTVRRRRLGYAPEPVAFLRSPMRFPTALIAACIFGLSIAALAQPVSFGVIGGASVTQDFQNRTLDVFPDGASTLSYSLPKRWIAGGMIELRLPLHLAIEADGLYHELEYIMSASVAANGAVRNGSPGPVVTWEIPVLAKYRFSFPMANPFVEAGPSFRASYNLNGTYPSNHGFTAGVGVETHAWRLRIAPLVRYTRWTRDRFVPPIFSFALNTVPDQVALLVAISF